MFRRPSPRPVDEPPVEQSHQPVDPTIESVIAESYTDMLATEAAWNEVDTFVRQALSDEQVEELTVTLDDPDEEADTQDKNRQQERLERRMGGPRYIRGLILKYTADAKYDAQLIFRNPEDESLGEGFLDKLAAKAKNTDDRWIQILINLRVDSARLYLAAYQAEAKLMQPLYNFLSSNAGEIESLLAFFQDEEIDLVEYRALLEGLSHNYYDPEEVSAVRECVRALGDTPEIHKVGTLRRQLGNVALHEDNPAALDHTEQWFRLFGRFALEHKIDLQDFVQFLRDTPLTEFPDTYQTDLATESKKMAANLTNQFEKLLQRYRRPERFWLTSDPRDDAPTQVKKQRPSRRSGGRVTKGAVKQQDVLGAHTKEVSRTVQHIEIAKQVEGTVYTPQTLARNTEDTADWIETAVGIVMTQREFSNYTDRYRNEADVRKMLAAIFEDPRRAGVTAMSDQRVNILDETAPNGRRKHQVLHFSPKDSAGLGLSDSAESNRTRIYFCLSDGRITLLGIQHKEKAEHMRGRFRK